jgi:hypothetical protein
MNHGETGAPCDSAPNTEASRRKVYRNKCYSPHVRTCILSVLLFIMAACVPQIPATTPPQLQHTPGAFVVVDERIYDAGVFRVAYPSGWRIVKSSIAAAPMEVVFVSPDDAIRLELYVSGACIILEGTLEPHLTDAYASVPIAAGLLCLYGRAPIEREAEFRQIFEQVRDSVRSGD